MPQIVDFYNVRPDELKPGDVLVATVALHITWRTDKKGKPMYRVYRCGYPPQLGEGDIPQGGCIGDQQRQVAEALFPVIRYADLNPD